MVGKLFDLILNACRYRLTLQFSSLISSYTSRVFGCNVEFAHTANIIAKLPPRLNINAFWNSTIRHLVFVPEKGPYLSLGATLPSVYNPFVKARCSGSNFSIFIIRSFIVLILHCHILKSRISNSCFCSCNPSALLTEYFLYRHATSGKLVPFS